MSYINIAHGGDAHYNENNRMYPQNVYIKDRPEYGDSTQVIPAAGHWSGGYFSEARDIRFNDPYYKIQEYYIGQQIAVGDSLLVNVLPGMATLDRVHYVIWNGAEGVTFDVKIATTGEVLGTIDASDAQDGIFILDEPIYIPGDTNSGIELEITGWVDASGDAVSVDPCLGEEDCASPIDLCMTITPFYTHFRGMNPCESTCYSV